MQWILVSIVLVLLGTGCASVDRKVRGNEGVPVGEQMVMFDSRPQGARLVINDVERGITPMLVPLSRKKDHKYQISFPGYLTVHGRVGSSMSGKIAENLAFIWLPPVAMVGAGTDYLTGAGKKLSPEEVLVTLSPSPAKGFGGNGIGNSGHYESYVDSWGKFDPQ